ncbi:MAG: endonuclease domain-containing protein [Bacteroidetes bacterium]|nr:endonuclease domain-containing protein [Bacteroidota bacterium]MBU1679742.1 endonuclease domain-containing protein [Bacteroidota bacterium]
MSLNKKHALREIAKIRCRELRKDSTPAEKKLIIELDGEIHKHQLIQDAERKKNKATHPCLTVPKERGSYPSLMQERG